MAKANQEPQNPDPTANYEQWLLIDGEWVWRHRAKENMSDLLSELRAASWAKTIDQNW